jgi:hypothetical protein
MGTINSLIKMTRSRPNLGLGQGLHFSKSDLIGIELFCSQRVVFLLVYFLLENSSWGSKKWPITRRICRPIEKYFKVRFSGVRDVFL